MPKQMNDLDAQALASKIHDISNSDCVKWSLVQNGLIEIVPTLEEAYANVVDSYLDNLQDKDRINLNREAFEALGEAVKRAKADDE